MRMHKVIMMVAPLTVALSMAPAARAEQAPGPCKADVQKFCPDVKPGGGALRACLKEHASELSPACQARIKQAKATVQKWQQACGDDAQKFCPDVKPGGGALLGCLNQHASELSPTCQEQLKQAKAKVQKWQEACQDDVQKFCASVSPGGGKILKCLRAHRDELSTTCQNQIAQAKRRRRHHAAAAQ